MQRKASREVANFSINIRPELLEKIEELARKENRSRNNMIECLLDRAIKEAGVEKG